MRPPKHVQNTAVKPSWKQLWREIRCAIWGHQFFVGPGGHYRGMPQSHCWWCGKKHPHMAHPDCAEWTEPLG